MSGDRREDALSVSRQPCRSISASAMSRFRMCASASVLSCFSSASHGKSIPLISPLWTSNKNSRDDAKFSIAAHLTSCLWSRRTTEEYRSSSVGLCCPFPSISGICVSSHRAASESKFETVWRKSTRPSSRLEENFRRIMAFDSSLRSSEDARVVLETFQEGSDKSNKYSKISSKS